MTEETETEIELVANRYDVLAEIRITREKVFEEKKVARSNRRGREKSEADLLIEDVKNTGAGAEVIVAAQVIKIVASARNTPKPWFSESVGIAARRAALMYGRSILNSLSERAFQCNADSENHVSKTVIDGARTSAIFKVFVTADDKVAGFAVCSPSDAYSKSEGYSLSEDRYQEAVDLIGRFPAGKKYEMPMTCEAGVANFGVVVGENEDARKVSDEREARKKDGGGS